MTYLKHSGGNSSTEQRAIPAMYIFIVLAALLALTLSCATTTREDVPRLGGLFGLTGFASFAGESSRDGFLLAIHDYGKPVDYVIEDHQSDMKTTVTAARKLIDVDGIDIIIGPEWEFGAVISPMAERQEALFITPWLTLDTEWAEPEWFISAMPAEQLLADRTAEHMVSAGVKSVVIIRSRDDFALTVETDLKKAFRTEGIEVLDTITADTDASDYRTEILRLSQISPDAVYVVFASDNAQGLFMREMKELGMDQPTFINQARGESDVFLAEFAEAADGARYVALKKPPRMDEFSEKFENHYGRKPGAISAATAYDVTTMVLKAHDAGARTPQEIHDYLYEQKEYEGYSGTITFADGFRASADTVVKEIRDGNRVIIG